MGERRASAATVLIVEDDVTTRQLLEQIFRDEGFTTVTSSDLAGARSVIEDSGLPDIGLIDFALPDGVGSDLCEDLRARNVPCLIVSAYPTWLVDSAHPEPNWVSKPFDVEKLVRLVRERLGQAAA
jgi:DNA-binding response OmpR family regulator